MPYIPVDSFSVAAEARYLSGGRSRKNAPKQTIDDAGDRKLSILQYTISNFMLGEHREPSSSIYIYTFYFFRGRPSPPVPAEGRHGVIGMTKKKHRQEAENSAETPSKHLKSSSEQEVSQWASIETHTCA